MVTGGAPKTDQLGGRISHLDNQNRTGPQIVRAELAWSDHATALGLVARSNTPILKLCRMLLEAGYDSSAALEAWRGGTLCLRVRTIGEAARLEVKTAGNGSLMFAPGRGATAPPVRFFEAAGVQQQGCQL